MKKILLFLLISNYIFAQWSISNTERLALITIYNSTNGENWNRNWDFNQDPKNWFGVIIKNGFVEELNLSNNLLKGNFPNQISSFSKLIKLDISNNQLNGELSQSLSSLSTLTKLDVSYNNLTGDPTNAIKNLTNLKELRLGKNNFSVSDINNLLQSFNSLEDLDLSDFGLVSIPNKTLTFVNLKELNLSNNPIDFSSYSGLSIFSKLESLSLSGNQLTQIPNTIFTLQNLKTLDLSNNNFNEQNFIITKTNKKLEWLSLESNQFTQVPQLANFSNLRTLNLGRNKISDGLSALSSLKKLQQLFLNHNSLSGNFPSIINDLPSLLFVSLDSNQLSGELPKDLPEITHINNNRFTKNQISNFLFSNKSNHLEFIPQRYDEPKTIAAAIGESTKLTQSLSGNYSFSWFKNLDQNIDFLSEALIFNNVEESDYATYTVEAFSSSTIKTNYFEFSFYREPITLTKTLGLPTTELKDIYIYPNPTKDYINIFNYKSIINKVLIFDLTGKQLIAENATKINVSRLPSAAYIIQIQTNNGTKNFKFIKE